MRYVIAGLASVPGDTTFESLAHQVFGRLAGLAAQVAVADDPQQLPLRTADEEVPDARLPHHFGDVLARGAGGHRDQLGGHQVPHRKLVLEEHRGILRKQPQKVLPPGAETPIKIGRLAVVRQVQGRATRRWSIKRK